jgi:hypothetical protein
MKHTFLKKLTFAALAAFLALCVAGCPNPADDNGGDTPVPPTPEPNPTVDALVEYFSAETINISLNRTDYGWMVIDNWNAPRLLLQQGGNTALVPEITISGTLSYSPQSGDALPSLTYMIRAQNPVTFDPFVFSRAEGERIVSAFQSTLGSAFSANVADVTAGYKYYGDIAAAITEFPDAGNISITITLIKDDVADATSGGISLTGVTIDAAGVTIDSPYSAAYNSGDKTLAVTIPAEGISGRGASAVASALASALNGKITNNVDTGYTAPGAATGAISGSNVVVTVPLGLRPVPAAVIANPVSAATDGNLSIAAGSVTGAAITALGNITDATGNVTAAYDSASHTVTITVSPAAAWSFSGADGFYNIVADGQNAGFGTPAINGLKRKFNAGTISNAVDPAYTSLEDVTYTVAGGNLVFTVTLSNYIKAAVITGGLTSVANASGITVASAASVTGAVISALGGVAGIASVETAYTSASHTVLITITPNSGYQFNPGLINGANPYEAVKTTLQAKIGGTAVNSVDAAYTSISPAMAIDVAEGKLRVSIILEALDPVTASDLVNAINGAADGNIHISFNMNTYQFGFSGAVITALTNIANATGAVSVSVLASDPGTYAPTSIGVKVLPASGKEFSGDYSTVITAWQTKVGSATVTYDLGGPFTVTATNGSVDGDKNLVLTADFQ